MRVFLCTEPPSQAEGCKAFRFGSVIKKPFDLLKHRAVWQLQEPNKISKGGPNEGRKSLASFSRAYTCRRSAGSRNL